MGAGSTSRWSRSVSAYFASYVGARTSFGRNNRPMSRIRKSLPIFSFHMRWSKNLRPGTADSRLEVLDQARYSFAERLAVVRILLAALARCVDEFRVDVRPSRLSDFDVNQPGIDWWRWRRWRSRFSGFLRLVFLACHGTCCSMNAIRIPVPPTASVIIWTLSLKSFVLTRPSLSSKPFARVPISASKVSSTLEA